MSNRFGYVKDTNIQETTEEIVLPPVAAPQTQTASQAVLLSQIDTEALKSVPRRQGRTEQKEQLNVRIPRELKRLASAQAALEGKSIGELVEELLIQHLSVVSKR